MRSLFFRLHPGEQLRAGIEAVCRREGVRYGAIASMIGSFRPASVVRVQKAATNFYGIRYSDPLVISGASELIAAQGTLGEDGQGNFDMHLHGTFIDEEGIIYVGHIIPESCQVLVTLEVALLVSDDVRIHREVESSGFPVFQYEKEK